MAGRANVDWQSRKRDFLCAGASIIRHINPSPAACRSEHRRCWMLSAKGATAKASPYTFWPRERGSLLRSGHLISLRACWLEPVMSRVEARYVT